ncbi:MAG TPA: cyanophycin synthetase [Candidatus Thermoplasmatota archaeon]|nr:cyanophycin synthetase [Candidatus Thermoplasmatota archaeon]
MRILEHRALRGPNLYSPHQTMIMVLDLEELEDRPSDRIPALSEKLLKWLPGLREHRCSPGYPGGFVERLERGTWAAHIVEHLAIELQTAAGMPVGFGKTRETKDPGVYTVVYRYREEESGLAAGRYAVEIVESIADGHDVDVQAMLRRLRELRESSSLGPSTGAIADEARKRGIPVVPLDGSYIQLGLGANQRRLQATLTDRTSGIGMEIADDKKRTKRLLHEAGVPVPRGETVQTLDGALEVAEELGYPVVVKPVQGNHGRGITTNIQTPDELAEAWDRARDVHSRIIVERYLPGSDFRVLLVDHKLVAAARRDPARVVGDGRSTIRDLIEKLNMDPTRGIGHEKALTRVEVDDDTEMMLGRQGLGLDSVPRAGEEVVLKSTANISSGGTATDVTDEVHPQVRALCERVSRIVNLDIMGIDIVAPTLRRPLQETGGGIVEVNAAPGLRMHLAPTHGKPRDVAAPIVDMLFPPGRPATIPVAMVTGTNGKTTTVRLIGHILRMHGGRVGITTTTGVEINEQPVLEGDYSGPSGALALITDPTVDHAVLEVARGGILRRGLPLRDHDVGVLLNIQSDHLGEGEIETLDDLARVKSVVVENVKPSGTAVLNAEDPLVVRLRRELRSNVMLFALDPTNREVVEHLEDGGAAVTVDDGMITIHRGGSKFPLLSPRDVPITLDGKAAFNTQNALAAVAACHALGVPDETICRALATFNPTVGQLPGRMNLLEVDRYHVLIDYGHNESALRALSTVLPEIARGGRILNVGSASGNRRDSDLRGFGRTLATMYDFVYLCDPDTRGRERGEVPNLIREGLLEGGFSEENIRLILDEPEAIRAALDEAQDGDLVVLQVDNVRKAVDQVRARQDRAPAPPRRPRGGPADRPAQEATAAEAAARR